MNRAEAEYELANMQDLYADCSGQLKVWTQWEVRQLINQIFNDHEAQLKAKDEEIERLKAESKQSYIEGSKSCDDLIRFYITKIEELSK